jgi:hypothetical protein
MRVSYRTSNILDNDTLRLATTLHYFRLLEVTCRIVPMVYQAPCHKNVYKLESESTTATFISALR